MQPKTTAWLALVALALGAFIYFVEIRGGEERAEAEAKGKRVLPAVVADDVERIVLDTSDGQRAVLERDGDAWRLVEPLVAPASEAAANAILNAAVELARESSVPAADDLAPFGLGERAPRLRLEGGGLASEVLLGHETPIDNNRYVLVPGSSEIDVVRSFRLNAFEEPLAELRDKRVLPFETATVQGLRLRWAGAAARVERRDGGWWMTEPVDRLADDDTVDTLLADLAYLRAEGFVDGGNPAALGLDAPVFGLVLETINDAGERAELGFAVGAPVAGDADLRVARGRGGLLYEIAAARLDDWPQSVVDVRDKTVSHFDVTAAKTFELVFSTEAEAEADSGEPVRVQAELAEAGWVSSGEAMDGERAAAMIAELAHLEGEDIVADALGETERSAIGLRPPHVRIRVWGEGDSGASAPLLAELSVGDLRPGRGYFVKRRDDDAVYLLDPAMADEIPTSLAAFRTAFAEGAVPEADAFDADAMPEGAAEGVPEI